MAYKDSDEIKANESYALGDYSFRIERTSVPGSTNDKIEAICTDKDGKNARKSIQILSGTKLDGWYVEANSTEASVYANVKIPKGGSQKESEFGVGPWPQPINYTSGAIIGKSVKTEYSGFLAVLLLQSGFISAGLLCSSEPGTGTYSVKWGTGEQDWRVYTVSVSTAFTYQDQTVYYGVFHAGYSLADGSGGINYVIDGNQLDDAKAAWTILYGIPVSDDYDEIELLVARFPIDIDDAGGVGPGSDWVDPGDYDPDWEEGDPTHTLFVTVTGALSGRHNDPIVDPSYSYIPADKETVKDYGCGGDGGHGGGGGAGASTVVVHKFATNQANSKDIMAFARRHGYGSGGGKGGKGGDGCILVYY